MLPRWETRLTKNTNASLPVAQRGKTIHSEFSLKVSPPCKRPWVRDVSSASCLSSSSNEADWLNKVVHV